MTVCVILHDMAAQSPADSHSAATLLSQYLRYSVMSRVVGKIYGMRVFERESQQCEKLQEKLLHDILRRNKDTIYARKEGLSQCGSAQQFTEIHPVTVYDHFKTYIDAVINGHTNVLSRDDPAFIATTSGTTGTCKRFPITAENAKRIRGAASLAMLYTHRQIYRSLKRIWQFRIMSKPSFTKIGLPMTGLSNIMAKTNTHNIVPSAISKIYNEYPAFYVQAIFALTEPELFFIDGFSSNLMYSFFKFLETNYDQLCHDIATGSISTNVDISNDIRDELNKLLKPNQSRATFIQHQVEIGSTGLAKRIWPDLQFVHIATSASMKMCANMLKKSYLQGTTIFQMAHGASEALVGYQMEDDVESEILTMLPNISAFLEFIPVEKCLENQPRTFPMDKVINSLGVRGFRQISLTPPATKFGHICPSFDLSAEKQN